MPSEPIEDGYKTEVQVEEFVERNAYYVILGITAIFIASAFFGKQFDELKRTFFLPFMGLALAYSICGVLPLLWMPKEKNAKHLTWLRHFKTVWYTYSIYFFLAGILSLGKFWIFTTFMKS